MSAKKKKKHLKVKYKLVLFFILFLFVFYFLVINKENAKKIYHTIDNKIKKLRNDIYKSAYNECINKPLDEEYFSEDTTKIKNDIISYAQNNSLKYEYSDLKNNYVISYNNKEAIYGASLIKLVTAIYLIDNDVDLSTKVKYESKHTAGSSDGMAKYSVGSSVSLEELMKYSISLSDNTAHHMIIDYIGKNKLKEYAQSLGATAIFTGSGDDYGNQTTYDTTIYLKKAFELINTKEDGKKLKDAMFNTRKNSLNIDNKVTYAHKYGSYNEYFHDIGINFDDHPYTISILTTKGESRGGRLMNHLSSITKDFSDSYYKDLDIYCRDYANKKISEN